MIKFEDVIAGNYSNYPEEIQKYMKNYSELLRTKLISELIKNKTSVIMNNVENNNETFLSVLSEILENGTKGYNNMSTKVLIDTYLESNTPESFSAILENINSEL